TIASVSRTLSKATRATFAFAARLTTGPNEVAFTAFRTIPSYPALMRLSTAEIWAATSLPTLIILNSLMSALLSGLAAQALAAWIMLIRQSFPTNQFTKAIRYGPGFALVCITLEFAAGTKHAGLYVSPAEATPKGKT